jgi:hypothetical protein
MDCAYSTEPNKRRDVVHMQLGSFACARGHMCVWLRVALRQMAATNDCACKGPDATSVLPFWCCSCWQLATSPAPRLAARCAAA